MNKLYRIPIRKFSVHQCDWTRCWPKPDYGPVEVQRSVLLNGIKVAASKPLGAQIGCCTIMYQVTILKHVEPGRIRPMCISASCGAMLERSLGITFIFNHLRLSNYLKVDYQ